MKLLQERYVKDREAGADSEPEGHGHEAEADDDPAVIKPQRLRVCFSFIQ
jgi:hypothetical protein